MLSERKRAEIVDQYDQRELRVSTAYVEGGTNPLWPRFSRSAGNQISDGQTTLSRYAIWANTVRDNIVRGMEAMESGGTELGHYHLTRAANSLSAFSCRPTSIRYARQRGLERLLQCDCGAGDGEGLACTTAPWRGSISR